MNKFISVLLVFALLFALAIPLFAEESIENENDAPLVGDDTLAPPVSDSEPDGTLDSVPDSVPDGAIDSEVNVDEAREALSMAIDKADGLILTDYTDESVARLTIALELAQSVLDDESSEYSAILEATVAINDALIALEAKRPDLTELKQLYTYYKYSDTKSTYNQNELAEAMTAAEAALSNSAILISEAQAVVNMLKSVSTLTPINSAEEFMAMEANGSYVLNADISINKSYDEFCGYLCGNGYSIKVTGEGIFNTLNGATICDLNINGIASGTSSIGALADTACGKVLILDVINNATVTATGVGVVASGFIAQGVSADISFKNCINRALIDGDISAGFYGKTISGENRLSFYNCANGENISGKATAAGFVADTTEGNTEYILFSYCASRASVRANGSASAFFGIGCSNIEMYGCVAECDSIIALENAQKLGGVIGYVSGNYGVDIAACYFNINFNTNDNGALIVSASDEVKVAIINVYAVGEVYTAGNNAYRIANVNNDELTLRDVLINVSLKTQLNGENIENVNAIDTLKNTDFDSLDAASLNEANCKILAFTTASKEMNAEHKAESVKLFIEAFSLIMTPAEAALKAQKQDITNLINSTLKAPDDYTADSYSMYMSEINEIFAQINAISSEKELEAIKYVELLAIAESRLVTLLDSAKADALVLLSAKRENAGKIFTQKSYEAYCEAYDLIVKKIENAESVEALKAINLPALKVAAELKLIVDVPDDEENDSFYNDDKREENENPDENDDNQVADTPKTDSGCLSSTALSAILIVGAIGVAFMRKNKND